MKIDTPEEAKEDPTLLVCNYCDKKIKKTQGISVHIKCVHIECNDTQNKVKYGFNDSHQELEENFCNITLEYRIDVSLVCRWIKNRDSTIKDAASPDH